jgi:hypothetical protein
VVFQSQRNSLLAGVVARSLHRLDYPMKLALYYLPAHIKRSDRSLQQICLFDLSVRTPRPMPTAVLTFGRVQGTTLGT